MIAALVPVLILLVAAFGFFLLAAAAPLVRQGIVPALAWTGIVGSAMACYRLWGYRLSAIGWVESDSLGQFLSWVILTGLALAMPVLMAQRKLGEPDTNRFVKHFGWFFVSSAGLLLVCSTRNLGVMFVSIEALCVGAWMLCDGNGGTPSRSFLLFGNRVGSALVLLGLFCFAVTLKTLDLAEMETALVRSLAAMGWGPVAGLMFMVVGLFAKLAGLVSLVASPGRKNVAWLGILASLAPVAVFGFLLRVTGWLLSLAEPAAIILGAVSVLGVSIGIGLALREGSIENRVAFGSLAHIGYLFLGLAVGGVEARSSVLFYLLIYALTSVGTFSVISSLGADRGGWRGLTWARPLWGLAMSLFLLSLAALAPAAGLVARFYLFAAAMAGEEILLVAVGLAGWFLGAYGYLGIVLTFYQQASPMKPDKTLGVGGKLALVLLSAAVFGIGVLPEPWLSMVRRVTLEFF